MFFIIVWLPLHTCMDNDRDKYCKYNDMDDIMICSPLHICTDNDFKDNHCNYNDKNDIMIIIPLHLCTDTPCHLPTWTAPPCNWPKDQKIKFSLQLSQKGFCSLFQKLSNTRSLKNPNSCKSDILANLQKLVKNTFSSKIYDKCGKLCVMFYLQNTPHKNLQELKHCLFSHLCSFWSIMF